jgi:hypothetical protein
MSINIKYYNFSCGRQIEVSVTKGNLDIKVYKEEDAGQIYVLKTVISYTVHKMVLG